MKLEIELAALYQGGQPEKVRLQNAPETLDLADWLLRSSYVHRWEAYVQLIRIRAEKGGALYLTPKKPDSRWLKDCSSQWQREGKTLALPLLEALQSQEEAVPGQDWPALYTNLIEESRKGTWLRPDGEALAVCLGCRHHIIAPWDHAREQTQCGRCRSDVFQILPVLLHPDAKQAMIRGILLEVAASRALTNSGGELFRAQTKSGAHTVGLPFDHIVAPVELDGIGDIADVLIILECKDLAEGNTLAINTLDQTASKVKRLLAGLGEKIRTAYGAGAKLIVVTTGKLDPSLKPAALSAAMGDLPCVVVDRSELPNLELRLRQLQPK